jgi:hypothetical protein
MRAKHSALKNVAEEIGQLPTRQRVTVKRETLQVEMSSTDGI